MKDIIFTDIEHDALKEIVSMGAGNASLALSKLINQSVTIRVPNLWLIPVEEVSGLMGGVEQIMTIVAIKVSGDATGVILLLLNEENAGKMTSLLSYPDKSGILEEVANIVVGAGLTSLSNFLKMSFIQSVPAIASDMLRAVINEVVADLGELTDQVLLLKVNLWIRDINASGDLYFLFDPTSSQKILQSCTQYISQGNG